MSIDIKESTIKCSTLERYAMVAHLLSKSNDSSDVDPANSNRLKNREEIEIYFNEVFLNIQSRNSNAYFQLIEIISYSLQNLDSSIIQSIDINCLDLLVEAISVFDSNEDCLYITFLCISELLIIDKFCIHFFSKDIFQVSLDAFYSDSENISYNALKVICAMIEFVLKNEIRFDVDRLLEKFEIDICKTLEHEYFVVSILRSIVEFSDFSTYYEKIISILCKISFDETPEENLNEVGETIYLILKQNFNYFSHIYYRTGIIGILLEQLNENTVQTYDIHFPIPILRIILCVIDHLKDSMLDRAINFAKSVSYDKYEELIRNSTIELSELALEVITFLIKYDKESFLNFEKIMANFIAEAPFVKKYLGINFFLSVCEGIEDVNNLEFLLSLNIIESCSFCLDSDECDVLNKYLVIILNLLTLSVKQSSKEFIQKIVEDVLKIDLFNRVPQVIGSCTTNNELVEITRQNLEKIDEIIQIYIS